MFGQHFFDAMQHVDGDYSDSVGTFPLRIALQESDRAFRTTGRDRLLSSESTGTILSEARVRRGGVIRTEEARYRVDRVFPSSVPGLSDLRLERVEGPAALVFDATDFVDRDETVTIDGRAVQAHINRSVEVEEVGNDGTQAVAHRISVAILNADAVGLTMRSVVELDGRRRGVAAILPDGVGLTKVLL